jgi:CheY-like chemotaxis protein
MNQKCILVVEDEADAQEIVARLLGFIDRMVEVVPTAEDALVLLKQNHYDGALVDLALPEMDGLTLLRLIRDNPVTEKMPLIAYTAHHSARVRKEAMDLGCDSYLTKPFNEDIFIQEVLRVM